MKFTDKARRTKGGFATVTAGVLAAGLLTSMMAPAFAQDQAPAPLAAAGSYAEQVLAKSGDNAIDASLGRYYRIPALADLGGGVVLASYDGRPDGGDAPSPNSIVQRRSVDGGLTWGAPTYIARGQEAKNGNLRFGFSDPSYVVDKVTGDVFNFHVYSKDQGFQGSGYGNDDANRQIIGTQVSVSRDKGLTWSTDPGNMPVLPPANYAASSPFAAFDGPLITDVVKPVGDASNVGGVAGLFAASGEGIQLQYGVHKGRLIQQFTGKVKQANGSTPYQAYSVYSDDHGKTWQRGSFVGDGMDENKTVELSNGDVMLNSRISSGGTGRKVAISKDGGETYGPVTVNSTLIDPVNNASIARMYPNAVQGSAEAKMLLFSNANSTSGRSNGTIRYSCDDGTTWSAGKQFKSGYMAYSTVTALSDGTFGLFYEADGNAMTFGKFDAAWLEVNCGGIMSAALTAANGSGANGSTVDVALTVTNNGTDVLSGAVASLGVPVPGASGKYVTNAGWTAGSVTVPNVAPGASTVVKVPVGIPSFAKVGEVTFNANLTRGTDKVTTTVRVAVTGGAADTVVGVDGRGELRAPLRNVATTPYAVGDKVGYNFMIRNAGNIAAEIYPTAGNFNPLLRVAEGGTADAGNCRWGSLPVAEGYTCNTALHAVTADELANGYFVPLTTWKATAGALTKSTTITGDEVDLLVRKPSISLAYTAGALMDVDGSGFASVGDTVTYTSVVTNTGNVKLADVTGFGAASFDLAVAESKTSTSVYTLTAADVSANKVAAKGLAVSARNGAKVAAASVSSAPVAACGDELCGAEPPIANRIPQREITIASVSSEELTGETAPNGPAAALLDGNPDTFWHTKWSGTPGAFPHSVVFNLGKSYQITGFEYTQRQNATNGKIKDYEIFVSDSLTDFGTKVASGSFTGVAERQRIVIAGNKAGRYVKLVGLNSIAGNAFGGGAEVNIGGLAVTAGAASVTATPGSVEAGKDISVSLSGFPASTAVALTLDGGASLGSVTTDAAGKATTSVTVPASILAGNRTVTATAGAVSATVGIVVTAVPSTGTPVVGATIKGERTDTSRDMMTSPYTVGQELPYSFVVKSTADIVSTVYPTAGELSGFNIDGTPNCRYRNIPVGGGYTCTTAKRVITAQDVANGFFQPVTQWTAEGTGATSVNYTIDGGEVDVLVRRPSLALTVGTGVLEDKDASGFASVGDVVSFPVTAKNDGNVALTGLSLPDTTGAAATLAAGASTVGTFKHTVTAADLIAKKVAEISVAGAAHNGVKNVANTAAGVAFALELAPEPTQTPSASPSVSPSAEPSVTPSASPSVSPSVSPSASPSVSPSVTPSASPTISPSVSPSATVAPTAAPPAEGEPSGSVGSGTVSAGGTVTITGKNFKPGTTATFTLHSDPVVLGTAVVGADGTVSLTAKLPANVPAGAHTVVIAGMGADGKAVEVSIAVKVAPTGAATGSTTGPASAASSTAAGTTGDALANTGFGLLPVGLMGGLLLLLGGTLALRRFSPRGARQ
ncbi:discoidin domain-containing protein [Arthrobacter sp. LAPM80]|uniref:discoidin domain-containing protein n=1 Tax=Arthrobacter sp. LAPM80 TaxID=3141788 RepID=UPI00398AE374